MASISSLSLRSLDVAMLVNVVSKNMASDCDILASWSVNSPCLPKFSNKIKIS